METQGKARGRVAREPPAPSLVPGAEPVPRERYLPLLARSAERIALPSAPLAARRLAPVAGLDTRATARSE